MAITDSKNEALWVAEFLTCLEFCFFCQFVNLRVNNNKTILQTNNPKFYQKTKNIKVYWHQI